jgi:hypothetical protein
MQILAAGLLLVAPLQEKFDSSKHPWLKHKTKTYVEFETTVEINGHSYQGMMRKTFEA